MRLPSGRVIPANADIIGIDDEGELFEGYDGRLCDEAGDRPHKWGEADRVALANAMIERWTAYRDGARRGDTYRDDDD